MRPNLLPYIAKKITQICLLLMSFSAFAENNSDYIQHTFHSDYYVVCYFYDKEKGLENDNPNLMYPSLELTSFGVRKNYVWARTSVSSLSNWTKLTGKIVDGFFIEEHLTYNAIKDQCRFALDLKFPEKSYELFEYKAAASNFSAYEYPIQFSKAERNESQITKIVLFGDSLSDAGNLKHWTKIMPFYPFWYGRFADGYVWNDYLTERTHLPVLNFAFGGAKTDGTNDPFTSTIPTQFITAMRNLFTGSSKYYVNSYLNSYLTTDSYHSYNQNISNPNETLFIIWIGANDFLEKFENKQPAHVIFDNPDAPGGVNYIAQRAADNIQAQIKQLSSFGAKHFLVLNLPDLGKTPIVLTANYHKYSDDEKNKREFSLQLSQATNRFNTHLKEVTKHLQTELKNKININILDMNAEFNRIMQNENIFDNSYFDYGFTKMNSKYLVPNSKNYIQDFCYTGGYYKTALTEIGSETILTAVKENKCSDQEGNIVKHPIFFNSPHPSSYAQCWIMFAVEKTMIEKGLLHKKMEDILSMKKYCQGQML